MKAELISCRLGTQGTKEALLNRLSTAIQEIDIDELWQKNKYFHEKLRDIEDRSFSNNLKINGLREVENETWGQTEQILKEWFKKTRIEDVNIEKSHRLGNIKNLPRTVVAKFFSFKGKQFVLYVAKMLKRQNIYTDTSLRRRWILRMEVSKILKNSG